jgi:hypothetical protein
MFHCIVYDFTFLFEIKQISFLVCSRHFYTTKLKTLKTLDKFYLQLNEFTNYKGPGWLNGLSSWDYLTTHTSLSPIRHGFAPGFVNYKKGCTRLATANDKVYQLLAHGRWFSPGTPASSTTKTGRHDIAEILLKVALKHQKSKSNHKL